MVACAALQDFQLKYALFKLLFVIICALFSGGVHREIEFCAVLLQRKIERILIYVAKHATS